MNEQTRILGVTELAGIVSEGNALANQLLNILNDERTALARGRVDDIDACGRLKADCVTRLEELNSDQRALCATLDFAGEDLDVLFAGYELAHAARPGWKAFLGVLAQCREANTINGQITLLRRRHVERALHILRGGHGDDAGLYGPDGRDAIASATVLGQA